MCSNETYKMYKLKMYKDYNLLHPKCNHQPNVHPVPVVATVNIDIEVQVVPSITDSRQAIPSTSDQAKSTSTSLDDDACLRSTPRKPKHRRVFKLKRAKKIDFDTPEVD